LDGAPHKTDPDSNPNVFKLERNDDGLWLNDNWAKPGNEWNPDNRIVFRLRKPFLSAILQCAVFLTRIFQIFLPTAQHFTDLLEPNRQILTIPVRDELPSQATEMRNLSKSKIKMHFIIFSILFSLSVK